MQNAQRVVNEDVHEITLLSERLKRVESKRADLHATVCATFCLAMAQTRQRSQGLNCLPSTARANQLQVYIAREHELTSENYRLKIDMDRAASQQTFLGSGRLSAAS